MERAYKERFPKGILSVDLDAEDAEKAIALWAAKWMAEFIAKRAYNSGENATWIRNLAKELDEEGT